MKPIIAVVLFGALTVSAPAQAQQQGGQQQQTSQTGQPQQQPQIIFDRWGYEPLYGSTWSLQRLIDNADVVGPYGDDIGSVENVIMDRDGQTLGIIAQVGGFLDIGDTHVFVPWQDIRINQALNRVIVPVTVENLADYGRTGADDLTRAGTDVQRTVDDDVMTGPDIWKATDLINDYAYLNQNVGYGYINDLLLDRQGKVAAIVLSPDAIWGGGYRAFPYRPYGWNAGRPTYSLGVDRTVAEQLGPFDYSRMYPRSPPTGTAATGRGAGN